MKQLFVLVLTLLVINPFWGKSLRIIGTAQRVALLKHVSFSDADFPRWQALLAVSMIGVLVGLDPGFIAPRPGTSVAPMWGGALIGLASTWMAFLVIVGVLRWWLPRGGRWDKRGDLVNLVAASWLIADALGAGLTVLGVPPLLTLPLWLYSVYVGAKAMTSAIPQVSMGYAIAGIAIGLVPAFVVSGLVFVLFAGLLSTPGALPGAGT
jgi:hypothetical protein